MKRFLIILGFFVNTIVYSQQVFYQDVFQGGVTGDGIGTFNTQTPYTFHVDIPNNSSIRSAYLFVTTNKTYFPSIDSIFYDRTMIFNSTSINLSKNDIIINFNAIGNGKPIKQGIIAIDVTNLVSPTQNNYMLIPPTDQLISAATGVYSEFYLYIAYENSNLQKVNPVVILNEQDNDFIVNYNINNINPMDTGNDIGFAFHATAFCDTIRDGSYVYVNSNLLGLTGGDELPPNKTCTGVWGSFNYNNGTLFGLANDIANNTMEGADAIANIQPYINNPNQVDITFHYQDSSFQPYSNSILQLFLTYNTPCDNFSGYVTSDTTICYGEQIKLHATGGQNYEWKSIKDTSSNDLSCTNCPNPVFSGDSSQVYTVRIWNNDSCSVVKPVRVQVAHPQKPQLVASATICGKNDGAIKINNTPENFSHWEAHTPTGDTLALSTGNTFTQLAAGEYNVYHVDTFGCKSEDTLAVVNSYKETVLAFTAEPLSGKAPLQVNITNNSHYTDTLIWLLNGEEQPQPFTGFSATTAGEYEVQLIGWQNAKTCADTLRRTIWVYDNTIIAVSGAISPNGDGKNDVFYIKNLEKFPGTNVWIYNRWGNLVYHSDNYQNDWSGTSQSQTTIGKGNKLPEGTYYYVIQLGGDVITKKEDRIKEGFFYLKR